MPTYRLLFVTVFLGDFGGRHKPDVRAECLFEAENCGRPLEILFASGQTEVVRIDAMLSNDRKPQAQVAAIRPESRHVRGILPV